MAEEVDLPKSKKLKLSEADSEALLARLWIDVAKSKEEAPPKDAPTIRVLQFNTLADGEW